MMAGTTGMAVFDNGLDYTMVVGDEAYEMNAHANEPNGVCIYLGEIKDLTLDLTRPLFGRDIPYGVHRAMTVIARNRTRGF